MLPLAGGDYGTVLGRPGNDFAIQKLSWPGEDPATQTCGDWMAGSPG